MDKNELLNNIYQQVLSNYYKEMQNIVISDDPKRFNYINKEFQDVIELLNKGYNGEININSIMLLKKISFNNFLKDKNIIEAVSSNMMLLNSNNLFIRKTIKEFDDYSTLFRIVENNGSYKVQRYCEDQITGECIDINELDEFVSLHKVLNDSEYVGFSARQWTYDVTVLYSGKIFNSDSYFTLYIGENDTLEFYVTNEPYFANGFFQNISNIQKSEPYIIVNSNIKYLKSDDNCSDKTFIIDIIEEQIKEKYNQKDESVKSYSKGKKSS